MLTPTAPPDLPTDARTTAATPEGVDPEVFATFRAFVRVGHAHRQLIGSLMGEAGGHPAQAGCLRALSAHDGISQRDLARTLLLTPPSVTTMLQRMQKAGFVERRPDPVDQRLTRVHLTDAGRELSTKVHARFGAHLIKMFGGFGPADLNHLRSMLDRMADNITSETATKAAE